MIYNGIAAVYIAAGQSVVGGLATRACDIPGRLAVMLSSTLVMRLTSVPQYFTTWLLLLSDISHQQQLSCCIYWSVGRYNVMVVHF